MSFRLHIKRLIFLSFLFLLGATNFKDPYKVIPYTALPVMQVLDESGYTNCQFNDQSGCLTDAQLTTFLLDDADYLGWGLLTGPGGHTGGFPPGDPVYQQSKTRLDHVRALAASLGVTFSPTTRLLVVAERLDVETQRLSCNATQTTCDTDADCNQPNDTCGPPDSSVARYFEGKKSGQLTPPFSPSMLLTIDQATALRMEHGYFAKAVSPPTVWASHCRGGCQAFDAVAYALNGDYSCVQSITNGTHDGIPGVPASGIYGKCPLYYSPGTVTSGADGKWSTSADNVINANSSVFDVRRSDSQQYQAARAVATLFDQGFQVGDYAGVIVITKSGWWVYNPTGGNTSTQIACVWPAQKDHTWQGRWNPYNDSCVPNIGPLTLGSSPYGPGEFEVAENAGITALQNAMVSAGFQPYIIMDTTLSYRKMPGLIDQPVILAGILRAKETDITAPPSVTNWHWDTASSSISETVGLFLTNVRRDNSGYGPSSVQWQTCGSTCDPSQTATAGVDYGTLGDGTELSGTATFGNLQSGDYSLPPIPIINRKLGDSSTTTLKLTLSNALPTGTAIVSPATQAITIVHDGHGVGNPGVLTMPASTVSVTAPTSVTATPVRNGGTSGAVTGTVATCTALNTPVTGCPAPTGNAALYTPISPTVIHWDAGFSIPHEVVTLTTSDTALGDNAVVAIAIYSPTGAPAPTIGSPQFEVVTINATAPHGVANLNASTGSFTGAGTYTATVSRTNGCVGAADVYYATADGSGSCPTNCPAHAGTNYTATSGSIHFNAGSCTPSGGISVPILDPLDSSTTHFNIDLCTGTNTPATPCSAPTGGLTIGGTAVQTVTVQATSGSAMTVVLGSSRSSSCVAPCFVRFDGYTGTSSPLTTFPFFGITYTWDFGDPGSGNWSHGKHAALGTPWSKNFDVGPRAGHLYTAAGTYTTTLTATDGTNTVAKTSVTTVTDPATVFSTTNTVCVNANSGDTTYANSWGTLTASSMSGDCPSGAVHTYIGAANCADWKSCIAYYAANNSKRILFKRGITAADPGGGHTVAGLGIGPGIVSIYGDPAAALPLMGTTGATAFDMATGASPSNDWRFYGLELNAPGASSSVSGFTISQCTVPAVNILVWSNKFRGFGPARYDSNSNPGCSPNEPESTGGGVIENDLGGDSTHGCNISQGCYMWGIGSFRGLTEMGNFGGDVDTPNAGTKSHMRRSINDNDNLFAHNTMGPISNPMTGGGGAQLNYQYGQRLRFDMHDNDFHLDNGFDTAINLGCAGGGGCPAGDYTRDGILDDNLIEGGYSGSQYYQPVRFANANRVRFANNLFNMPSANHWGGFIQLSTDGPERTNLWIYDNDFFGPSNQGSNVIDDANLAAGTWSNVDIRGNVLWEDNATQSNRPCIAPSYFTTNASPVTFSNNLERSCNQSGANDPIGSPILTAYPFTTNPPVNADDFKIPGGSQAIGAGYYTPMNQLDTAGALRVNPDDAGAWKASTVITASRTSCTAPCFVYFDATNSDTDLDGNPGEWVDDLVNGTFSWNFGDSLAASKTWLYGARATTATPLNKNTDLGFVAGHLFEQPGTYVVSLTLKNSANVQVGSGGTTIVVSDWVEDATTSPTYCVSVSGTFDGPVCSAIPAGRQITSSNFQTAMNTCTNSGGRKARCLFRAGESFSASSAASNLVAGTIVAGGSFYGFGPAASPTCATASKACINITGTSAFGIATDVRVFGFLKTGGAGMGGDNSGATDVIFWNNEFNNDNPNGPANNLGFHSAFIDNYFHDMATNPGYCWIGELPNGAFLDNRCKTSTVHAFRSDYMTKTAIAHNSADDWGTAGVGGDGFKLGTRDYPLHDHTDACNQDPAGGSAALATTTVWVYDNEFQKSQKNTDAIYFGPQYQIDEPTKQMIVDSNFFQPLRPYSNQDWSGAAIHFGNCDGCVARNNTQASWGPFGPMITTDDNYSCVAWPSQNQSFIGNSYWFINAGSCTDNQIDVKNSGGRTNNITSRDNVQYHDTGSCGQVSCTGSNCVQDHNLNTTTVPFIGADNTTFDNFKNKNVAGPTGPAGAGQTTSGLLLDGMGIFRPTPPDEGAIQH